MTKKTDQSFKNLISMLRAKDDPENNGTIPEKEHLDQFHIRARRFIFKWFKDTKARPGYTYPYQNMFINMLRLDPPVQDAVISVAKILEEQGLIEIQDERECLVLTDKGYKHIWT